MIPTRWLDFGGGYSARRAPRAREEPAPRRRRSLWVGCPWTPGPTRLPGVRAGQSWRPLAVLVPGSRTAKWSPGKSPAPCGRAFLLEQPLSGVELLWSSLQAHCPLTRLLAFLLLAGKHSALEHFSAVFYLLNPSFLDGLPGVQTSYQNSVGGDELLGSRQQ